MIRGGKPAPAPRRRDEPLVGADEAPPPPPPPPMIPPEMARACRYVWALVVTVTLFLQMGPFTHGERMEVIRLLIHAIEVIEKPRKSVEPPEPEPAGDQLLPPAAAHE